MSNPPNNPNQPNYGAPYDPSSQPPEQPPYGSPPPYDSQPYGMPTPDPYGSTPSQPYGMPSQSPYGAPPQPPYGSQPPQNQYGVPSQQPYNIPAQQSYGRPPKKKRTGLFVALALILMIVCCIGGVFGVSYYITNNSDRQDPLKTTQQFYNPEFADGSSLINNSSGLLDPTGGTPNEHAALDAAVAGKICSDFVNGHKGVCATSLKFTGTNTTLKSNAGNDAVVMVTGNISPVDVTCGDATCNWKVGAHDVAFNHEVHLTKHSDGKWFISDIIPQDVPVQPLDATPQPPVTP